MNIVKALGTIVLVILALFWCYRLWVNPPPCNSLLGTILPICAE